MSRPKAGETYVVRFPFYRETVDLPDDDPEGVGFAPVDTWHPGVQFVACGYYGDDSEAVCDGEGRMVLTVVDVHKPGRFPERVFYTRMWVDPDGKEFGKGCLRITTVSAFVRRATGYMHEYRLRAADEIKEAA